MSLTKKKFVTIVGLTLLALAKFTNADNDRYEEWELPFLRIIDEQKSAPPDIAISKLGDIVGKLADDGQPELKESEVFKIAKANLISIPGHAEFFAKQIRRFADAEFNHTSEGASNDRRWFLHILGQLPSVETVRILGGLLYDERDPTDGAPSDSPYVPNSVAAAYALRELKLRDTPPEAEGGARHEVHAWQLWFELIQQGKRTFSFEGDDSIYTINGHIGMSDPPAAKHGNKRTSPMDKGDEQRPSSLLAIILLVFLILFGIGLWIKQKKY